MNIKRRFDTKEEYLDFVWNLINFDPDNIWKEEDLPKLQPFFDAQNKYGQNIIWDEKVKEGYEHYIKCREYADELFEIRDSLQYIPNERLIEALNLKPINCDCWDYDEDGNEIDEDGNIMPAFTKESLEFEDLVEPMEFPLVFILWAESSGPFSHTKDCVLFSQYVNLPK